MTNYLSIAAITTFISLVVTALFQYAPKLNVWWAARPTEEKKRLILAMYAVAGAAVAWGGCIAPLGKVFPQLGCVEVATFLEYIGGVITAVAFGQGVFGLAPEAKAVTLAKAARVA
jgi:hypothetical protein